MKSHFRLWLSPAIRDHGSFFLRKDVIESLLDKSGIFANDFLSQIEFYHL